MQLPSNIYATSSLSACLLGCSIRPAGNRDRAQVFLARPALSGIMTQAGIYHPKEIFDTDEHTVQSLYCSTHSPDFLLGCALPDGHCCALPGSSLPSCHRRRPLSAVFSRLSPEPRAQLCPGRVSLGHLPQVHRNLPGNLPRGVSADPDLDFSIVLSVAQNMGYWRNSAAHARCPSSGRGNLCKYGSQPRLKRLLVRRHDLDTAPPRDHGVSRRDSVAKNAPLSFGI